MGKWSIDKVKGLAHPGHCLRLPALPVPLSLLPGGRCAVGQTCHRKEIQTFLRPCIMSYHIFEHFHFIKHSGIGFPGWTLELLLLVFRSDLAEILSGVILSSQLLKALPYGREKQPRVRPAHLCSNPSALSQEGPVSFWSLSGFWQSWPPWWALPCPELLWPHHSPGFPLVSLDAASRTSVLFLLYLMSSCWSGSRLGPRWYHPPCLWFQFPPVPRAHLSFDL